MDEQGTAVVVESIVVGAMRFKEPNEILGHFLYLADTARGHTDGIIYNAIEELQGKLGQNSLGFTPRLLFGVELVSALCRDGEKRIVVTSKIERVLKQYIKVLAWMISGSLRPFSYHAPPFSDDEYELALDIVQVIAVSISQDSTGTINTLIRAIVDKAPEDAIKAKMEQLESPDFHEDRKEDRGKFYDIFVIAYLKRFYGMNKVMKQLRERKGLVNTVRIDTSGRRFCEMDESELWKRLQNNCEITDPTQDQHLQRQLMTAELVRHHPEDSVVKDWYEENFPELVRT